MASFSHKSVCHEYYQKDPSKSIHEDATVTTGPHIDDPPASANLEPSGSAVTRVHKTEATCPITGRTGLLRWAQIEETRGSIKSVHYELASAGMKSKDFLYHPRRGLRSSTKRLGYGKSLQNYATEEYHLHDGKDPSHGDWAALYMTRDSERDDKLQRLRPDDEGQASMSEEDVDMDEPTGSDLLTGEGYETHEEGIGNKCEMLVKAFDEKGNGIGESA